MVCRERCALTPSAGSVRAGRHFVAEVLSRWDLDGQVDAATLLVSEVVANAVVHAATACILDVGVDPDRRELVVSVTDYGAGPVLNAIERVGLALLMEEPDLESESGRGLLIVATVADRWGIEPSPEGNTVWFALSLDDAVAVEARPGA